MGEVESCIYVAVASSARVANLPVILELASPDDEVLLVVSPWARHGGHVEPVLTVLGQHGLQKLGTLDVRDLNDPGSLVPVLRDALLQRGAAHGRRISYILNGGTKLTPFCVLPALQSFRTTFLYNSSREPCYMAFASPDATPSRHPFVRHRLSLDDLLTANGFVRGSGQLLWSRFTTSGAGIKSQPGKTDTSVTMPPSSTSAVPMALSQRATSKPPRRKKIPKPQVADLTPRLVKTRTARLAQLLDYLRRRRVRTVTELLSAIRADPARVVSLLPEWYSRSFHNCRLPERAGALLAELVGQLGAVPGRPDQLATVIRTRHAEIAGDIYRLCRTGERGEYSHSAPPARWYRVLANVVLYLRRRRVRTAADVETALSASPGVFLSLHPRGASLRDLPGPACRILVELTRAVGETRDTDKLRALLNREYAHKVHRFFAYLVDTGPPGNGNASADPPSPGADAPVASEHGKKPGSRPTIKKTHSAASGHNFELLVADRVVRHVLEHQLTWAVQEVWQGVQCQHVTGDAIVFELDVVLVLRNAVLLAIECKSGEVGPSKELELRLFRTRRASSICADMALCVRDARKKQVAGMPVLLFSSDQISGLDNWLQRHGVIPQPPWLREPLTA